MIIKLQVYVESKQFSDPSVEKRVLEDLLSKSLTESLSIRRQSLSSTCDEVFNKTRSYRSLLVHLKELEATIPSTNQVLEKMRTGFKES